jgi:hypothetical protein
MRFAGAGPNTHSGEAMGKLPSDCLTAASTESTLGVSWSAFVVDLMGGTESRFHLIKTGTFSTFLVASSDLV